MDTELILAWKNPTTHSWIAVGRLYSYKMVYVFKYTKGAISEVENGYFTPFGQMQDLRKTYESEELFPIFQNRLLSKTRPEYYDYLDWLNLDDNIYSPLEELARSGGIRVTDDLQLFPVPKNTNGVYQVRFFSHGIRHLPHNYIERISHLNNSSKLYPMWDFQNDFDRFALALRTTDPPELVGYVPRFFALDFHRLVEINGHGSLNIQVEKINIKAPLQFKLLCKLTTNWPKGFCAFQDDEYEPLS